jgi:hypothetical protein
MKSFVMTKQLAIFTTFVLLITLAACGSGSSTANPNSVTGNWNVTLFDSNNSPAYVFTTTLNQQIASPSISSPVTGSKLNVTTTTTACFDAGSTAQQAGTYTLSDTFNGLSSNTLQLTITSTTGNCGASGAPPCDVIDMRGTFTTDQISGPWHLTTTGAGCATDGTFLMQRS